MKNRQDVCYAKDAGFIQFDGLSGLIRQDALPHLHIKAVIAPTMPIIPVPSQN